MSKKSPGLTKRNDLWHINKVIKGKRIYESTGTGDLEEAERYLAMRVNELRGQLIYGERKTYTFIEAATKYLKEEDKKSLGCDAVSLTAVMPFIGELVLEQIHMGTLQKFIAARKQAGLKNNTINRDLAVIRRVLTLASRLWRDELGNSWLGEQPLIQMLKSDNRKPYPLSEEEQGRLLGELPEHLQAMVLFAVHTGLRETELTRLRWDEEKQSLGVFVLPGDRVKNGEDRVVPLNSVAKAIIDAQRGKHDEYVFTFKGEPVLRINGHAWRKARKRANLSQCRVHDLRHTFGRRLKSVGVSFENRQDLLGHKSSRITDHYCKAELDELMNAVEKLSRVNLA
ncbi:tyrosine-type recombinase/integrase [Methylovulum psychrotolerans]|uniref:Integrase n=1 Tax=Methylovulum psychrotolerans TaxID=1704499 RepID=A0A1Z4C467_9GAMM|nr:site-specific integrase [Methylovulum psychrotolerans]ASF48323.1 integrase [Methylovulum psychrotolerans]